MKGKGRDKKDVRRHIFMNNVQRRDYTARRADTVFRGALWFDFRADSRNQEHTNTSFVEMSVPQKRNADAFFFEVIIT